MDRADYQLIMTEVFGYLEGYDPRLEYADFRELLAEMIWSQGVEDTGDTQAIYQYLRDRVESILATFKGRPGPLDWWPQA